MRKLILFSIISFGLLISVAAAQNTNNQKPRWDELYVQALEKIRSPDKTDGLGYTLSEEEALEKAIKDAIDQKGPACQVLKIGVDMQFNPYSVLTGIFNSNAKIDLEQLCLCATETGDDSAISKSVMLKAANDAVKRNRLRRDEVTQAQCLQQGLGFTVASDTPDRLDPKPKPPPYSPF